MLSTRCPIHRDKQLLIIHKNSENHAKIKTITDKRKCTRNHTCVPINKKKNFISHPRLSIKRLPRRLIRNTTQPKFKKKKKEKCFFSKCWEIRNSTRRHEGNTNDFKRAH